MNDTEIKIKLFQKIDTLKEERLIELYGVVNNFINGSDDSEEWNNLTPIQKEGLEYGLKELDNKEGVKHNIVMEELKKKYGIK